MRLVVSEKKDAAKRIAEILAVGAPRSEKVYTTPVHRFRRDGDEWVSIGLRGHIMEVDFPEEYSKWRLDDLEALVNAPVLKLPHEKGIIQSLKNLAKKADEVVIATDYDREGELIGSDAAAIVREVNPGVAVSRVRFSAITKDEIEKAFADPGPISEDLAQAGASRQDIDLIWGAVLTRYLTLAFQQKSRKPYGDVLSSGRVQTPTLKLIVDKEVEREAFVSEDYWVVKARFSAQGEEFAAGHVTERFKEEAAARAAMDAVSGERRGKVTAAESSRRQQPAPPPFNTTALMAAAASEGVNPARTMQVAERLYLAGLISYPRVDNTVYPASLDLGGLLRELQKVPAYAEHASRLARGSLKPTRGSKESTDHPPIHPTGAADPDRLDAQEWKIYNLVARRFMATLSGPATIEGTRVEIDVAGERFVAKGDVVVNPGFRAVYPYGLKKDEHLPAMGEGQEVDFLGATLEQKQTQPPSRYTQGRLIQEMEKLGLGTKATRHDIIQGLYDRKYTTGDPIEPTCKGRTVITALTEYAARITTPDMTRELDAEMDAIANARSTKDAVVGHSRSLLGEVMRKLIPIAGDVGETLKSATDEDAKIGKCPASGHDLMIKFSPKNRSYFVGCTGYPDCGQTYALPKNARFESVQDVCPECGTPQVKVLQYQKRPRVMCLKPDCPTKKGPEIVVGTCDKDGCGAELKVVYSQFGNRFIRCANYDPKAHPVSYPLPQSGDIDATGEKCEECGAPVVVVHTKKGPWKICVDPECPARKARRSGKGSGRRGAAGARGGRRKRPSS